MKKALYLSLFLGIIAHAGYAQDNTSIKPLLGSQTLEFQINPFTENPLQLSSSGFLSGIRYRKFNSANTALRLTANINYTRTSEVTQDAGTGGSQEKELRNIQSDFSFGIRPGFEKHCAGTRVIDPYIGGEFGLLFQTARRIVESQENNEGTLGSVVETVYRNNTGGLTVGLNGVAGMDIYILPRLYLGAELGYGLTYFSPFITKVKPPRGDEFETMEGKSRSFRVQPWVQSAIRVGFTF
jgi:hypothetical protein